MAESRNNPLPTDVSGARGARRWWLLWILLVAIGGLTIFVVVASDQGAFIDYSDFREQIKGDNVVRVEVTGQRIKGRLKKPVEGTTNGKRQFYTYLPSFEDSTLMGLLENHAVEIETLPEEDGLGWSTLIIFLFPAVLLFGFIAVMLRGVATQGKQVFRIGSNRARLYDRRKEKTRFEDVAGVKGAKRELAEVAEYLRDPELFRRLGAKLPRGVLLVGPPGTGKTLLARAVAGEAEVPFFSVTGSDFMEMFVGVGASRVRSMFEDAKRQSPSIVFIDELDSVGRRRGAGLGGGHDEREQTLNQLLSELDGFEPNENVIVLAATNRPDILDKALLRAGRFDRQVTVDLPSLEGRRRILEIHSRGKPLAGAVDLLEVARATPGFSGADLENLLNEAAILASREKRDRIARRDLEEARDKVIVGLVREGLSISPRETRIIATHEAGHALVAALLMETEPVHKVSVVPRGRALGATHQLPEEERYLQHRDALKDRLSVLLAGRSAEALVFDTTTNGAADDLNQATRLARKMVRQFGMSDHLGPVSYGDDSDGVFLGDEIAQRREYSEATAREIDEQVTLLLKAAERRAALLLQERRRDLDHLADVLLDEEEIDGARVYDILARFGASAPRAAEEKRSRQASL